MGQCQITLSEFTKALSLRRGVVSPVPLRFLVLSKPWRPDVPCERTSEAEAQSTSASCYETSLRSFSAHLALFWPLLMLPFLKPLDICRGVHSGWRVRRRRALGAA